MTQSKFKGGIYGMAIGDALGTTVEFMTREYVKNHPVTDLVGGGKFSLEIGQWTDDTSLGLCLAESLLFQKGFNGNDVVDKFHSWYSLGHLSSNGKCFDIGATTVKALLHCKQNSVSATWESNTPEAGNGSLMRVIPVILFFANDLETMMTNVVKSSIITHNSIDAIDSCRYFAALVYSIIQNPKISKEELLSKDLMKNYWDKYPMKSKNISDIKNGCYKNKSAKEIEGLGVVHKTLESVLWAFYKTDDFESGVLKVINLGDDADTTGAIYGALGGVFYSLDGIPKKWVEKVCLRKFLGLIGDEIFRFYKSGGKYQMSLTFKNVYDDYMFLEIEYRSIYRKLEPCPKSYKSVEEFDEDVKLVKEKYSKRKNPDSETWKEFEQRFTSNRSMLENKFFSFPPPPPDFNFDTPDQKNDTSSNGNIERGQFLAEIKKGNFKLRKVKK